MIELTIFVHGHYETGEPCEVDINNFSGLDIETDFIRFALACEEYEKIDWFLGMPVNTWIKAQGQTDCEDGQWYFEVKSYHILTKQTTDRS